MYIYIGSISSCEEAWPKASQSKNWIKETFTTNILLPHALSVCSFSVNLFTVGAMAALSRVMLLLLLLLLLVMSSARKAHYHKPKHQAGDGGWGDLADPAAPPSEPPQPLPLANGCNADNSSSDPCVFDVRSFGAVGDGSTDDTEALRSAWRAACAADVPGSILLVPSGGTFMITSTIFSGPCQHELIFQVDGVLMPPDGPSCWPKKDSRRQWIVFYRVNGMTLAGAGKIRGNGQEWWNLPCKPHRGPNGSTLPGPCDSPALIRFFLSSNLTVREIFIENSPQFHIKFDGCQGVRIEGISINSPPLSPNTDGIHIQDTKGVDIYNSIISNGDDCISIGTGCSAVSIENVTCGPSHGISIGSLGMQNTEGCVSNITVRNSVIRNSDNGVRIKTWQGGTGSVSDILFDTVYMENVRNCIIIDQYYCLSKECRNQTSAVYVTNVLYTNIKGTYDVRAPPIHFACSDTVPCTNITMSEVELLPFQGVLMDDPFCWNAYGQMETLTIPPMSCLQDGLPQSLTHDHQANISRLQCL